MGIKINSVISMTFVIGSFLAGVASILYFANYGQVSPMIGAMPGLKAFVPASGCGANFVFSASSTKSQSGQATLASSAQSYVWRCC